MFAFLASCLSLSLILAGSCSKASSLKTAWSLQLTTSGGFAGIGNGNLWLNSEGKFKYDRPTRPGNSSKPCEGKLSNAELQSVNRAVAQSQPKNWQRPDLNVAAPDAFGYKLELRTAANGQPFTAQWYDNTSDRLPEDLKRLSAALMQAMNTAAKKCPSLVMPAATALTVSL